MKEKAWSIGHREMIADLRAKMQRTEGRGLRKVRTKLIALD